MNPQSSYVFHQDPGHGWIEVPVAELLELGIAEKISNCSYERGNRVFLEEDCDAGQWVLAWQHRGVDVKPLLVEKHVEVTPIRSYARFSTSSGHEELQAVPLGGQP